MKSRPENGYTGPCLVPAGERRNNQSYKSRKTREPRPTLGLGLRDVGVLSCERARLTAPDVSSLPHAHSDTKYDSDERLKESETVDIILVV